MRRMFLVGILAIVAMMGNVTAQAVPNNDTALALNAYGPLGEASKECSGSWGSPSSCEFTCSPGDYLYVWGSTRGDRFGSYPVGVTVSASCGGVNVECTCLRRGSPISHTPPCTCEATSEDAVPDEEASGSCSARRAAGAALGSGEYYCSSFAPEEAAQWEASGEDWVIQIPEP